jgi:hypothetical protein
MSLEEATQLGIALRHAQEMFSLLCMENTKTDPKERAEQILRYETARVKMHEAMNRYRVALRSL